MPWDNYPTTIGAAPEDDVAARLVIDLEPDTLEGLDDLARPYGGQARH
jgi:hypothetical protein